MSALFSCQEEDSNTYTAPKKPTIYGKWNLVYKTTALFDSIDLSEATIGIENYEMGENTYSFLENGTAVIGSDSLSTTIADTFNFYEKTDSLIFSNQKTNQKVQTFYIMDHFITDLFLVETRRYPALDSNVKIRYHFKR